MMIQKFLPKSASQTKVHYEVYRNKNSSEQDFRTIADTYARVMKEDKALCDRAQANLEAGVFISGELHPRWEKGQFTPVMITCFHCPASRRSNSQSANTQSSTGPLHFQSQVREAITEHFQREKSEGREIWPARQQLPKDAVSKSDQEICDGLACGGEMPRILSW
jgi:hypothetical protein